MVSKKGWLVGNESGSFVGVGGKLAASTRFHACKWVYSGGEPQYTLDDREYWLSGKTTEYAPNCLGEWK